MKTLQSLLVILVCLIISACSPGGSSTIIPISSTPLWTQTGSPDPASTYWPTPTYFIPNVESLYSYRVSIPAEDVLNLSDEEIAHYALEKLVEIEIENRKASEMNRVVDLQIDEIVFSNSGFFQARFIVRYDLDYPVVPFSEERTEDGRYVYWGNYQVVRIIDEYLLWGPING